ncbi:hypothetical protein Bca4012_035377 [Brassica carinata]
MAIEYSICRTIPRDLSKTRNSAYKEDLNKMWDVGGDQFDSLDELNMGKFEFENLSLDETELEVVLFDREYENE